MDFLLVKIDQHASRQPVRETRKLPAAVVGVVTRAASLEGDVAVRICAEFVRGNNQIDKSIPEGGYVRCVAIGAGADRKHLVGAHSTERKRLSLSTLASVPAFTPWRIVQAVLYSQAQHRQHNESGSLSQNDRKA